MKRAIDIGFLLMVIVILSPLLVFVAVVLGVTGGGPVLYRQERVGRGGRTYGLCKFTTLLRDSQKLPGELLTRHCDPRVLPVGPCFLSAQGTSDRLPMSIVRSAATQIVVQFMAPLTGSPPSRA